VKPPTVEVLELLAARRAVSFTAESGFTNFIYEGDFDSAVQSIRSKGMENSQGMHLIKDIQSHVNSFQSISLSCNPARQCSCTCFNPKSRTLFSITNLVEVCSIRYFVFYFV